MIEYDEIKHFPQLTKLDLWDETLKSIFLTAHVLEAHSIDPGSETYLFSCTPIVLTADAEIYAPFCGNHERGRA